MTPPILWRRLDQPGHDSAWLRPDGDSRRINGVAVFLGEQGPCRLEYTVKCDREWRTLSGRVSGWIGAAPVELRIGSEGGRWTVNGVEQPAVAGCIDLDLSFTPATNLLSLRRLALKTGEEAQISVAWLRLPELTLEPLPQLYRALGGGHYWYDSNHGEFTAELRTTSEGFVTDYPPLWVEESGPWR